MPPSPWAACTTHTPSFFRAFSDFRELRPETRYLDEKRVVVAEQLETQVRLGGTLEKQQALLAEDLELARRDLERRQRLKQDGLLSATNAETAEKAFLQQRGAVENGLASINRNRIEIAGYRSSALELDRQTSEARRKRYLDLRKAIQALAAGGWQKKEDYYVIKAPHAGTVSS